MIDCHSRMIEGAKQLWKNKFWKNYTLGIIFQNTWNLVDNLQKPIELISLANFFFANKLKFRE